MDLDTFLVSLYVVVDEWWKQHHPRPLRRVGRPPSLSEPEVLTLAILAQWPRWRSERDFWRFADLYLRAYFPNLLSQGQLNRRIRALEPELRALQQDLAGTLADGSEVYRVIDTTLVPAIVRVRACRKGLFAGQAAFGRCASKTEWVYGFKVALSVSPKGVITSFGLAEANCDERPVGEFLVEIDGHDTYLADKGFSAVEWERRWLENLRCASHSHAAEERSPCLAGGSLQMDFEQAADRGGCHRPTERHLRVGASPDQDIGWAAGPAGGEGHSLYRRAGTQPPARSTTTSPRRSSHLNNSSSHV